MPISKPIPLRLSDDLLKRLDAASGKLGYARAQLIRYLVVRWLEYFEARRGNVEMPPDIEEVLRLQDGNACRYQIPSGAAMLNETASSSADIEAVKADMVKTVGCEVEKIRAKRGRK